jgi:hypothetical protein
MLKPRHIVAGLALLLALTTDSLAQSSGTPAPKDQQDQAGAHQQTTSADQRGTEQQPLIAQQLPTQKTTESAARDAREEKEKAKSDLWTWLLNVLTVGVLFMQALILAAQAYFLRGTLKATENAALGAKNSADALIGAESARLLILPVRHNYWEAAGKFAVMYSNSPQMGSLNTRITANFRLKNYGKTPATLLGLGAALACTAIPPPDIAPPPNRRFDERQYPLPLPIETVISADKETPMIEVSLPDFLDMREAIAIQKRETSIWFYGYVIYSDVFERECEERFAFTLDPSEGGFVRYYDRTFYRPRKD